VLLYPLPTVYPIISLSEKADRLIPALTDPDPQERAWGDHGFRGPLGRIGRGGPKVSGIAVAIESTTDAGRQRDARLAGATRARSRMNRLAGARSRASSDAR